MGSPRGTLAAARRAFQLQTAAAVCHQKTRRPSSRVPPSVQGGRLPPFFFSCKKKGGAKVKCALRKSISLPAGSDQRRRLWKPPPFEKGGRKLYRPSALLTKTPGTDYRLSARLSPQRGRVGRDGGGTPLPGDARAAHQKYASGMFLRPQKLHTPPPLPGRQPPSSPFGQRKKQAPQWDLPFVLICAVLLTWRWRQPWSGSRRNRRRTWCRSSSDPQRRGRWCGRWPR